MNTKALRAAFPLTIPVLTGYAFLGLAYGLLMSAKGFGAPWSLLMSAAAFCGSMQYAAVGLLAAGFDPVSALLVSLLVNARHLFYGVSMLEKYRGTGKFKPFLIFALSDETFSLVCSHEPPPGVDRARFYFFISLLDYLYWVAASALGGLLGGLIDLGSEGLDFVLTALFVFILAGQWRDRKNRLPAVIGVALTAACLALFGSESFLLPALGLILAVLTLLRNRLGGEEAETCL